MFQEHSSWDLKLAHDDTEGEGGWKIKAWRHQGNKAGATGARFSAGFERHVVSFSENVERSVEHPALPRLDWWHTLAQSKQQISHLLLQVVFDKHPQHGMSLSGALTCGQTF